MEEREGSPGRLVLRAAAAAQVSLASLGGRASEQQSKRGRSGTVSLSLSLGRSCLALLFKEREEKASSRFK